MDLVFSKVTESKLTEQEVFDWIRSDQHGGMNLFFGAVRRQNGGKEVVAVSYDAFTPLAENIFRKIAADAQERWGKMLRICIIHRVGKLLPGELSVAIGVSSPHRDESYQASRFIIETIKHQAPIWKKEHYENGETEWLKGHALCQRTHAHAHDCEKEHR